ncbi:DNA adenine methylase [Pleurocapsales cyanobacterium LEGE 06147]|nr:DNA adenine methylase [Pleurocapsales cyanobacterium LEGE 06147]
MADKTVITQETVKVFDKDTEQPLAHKSDKINCRPFVKWAGGKSQLLDELSKRVPAKFSRYFEPFVGGGALFFHLQPKEAYLSDLNPEVVNTYQTIRNKIDELIADLKSHIHSSEYFYEIRNADRTKDYQKWKDVKKASRFIYLNKTCYNGLYRVNTKGQFNVPFGKYVNPKIVDEDNFYACHKVLQSAHINLGSFLHIEEIVEKDDFVYFDPPYAPLNQTSNFTGYSRDGFDRSMQKELKNLCDRLTEAGVRFMLSNSSAPTILELYKNYNIEFIYAARAINSNAKKRGKIAEVIVTNFIN